MKLLIYGWKPGFVGIPFMYIIRRHFGLGLAQAYKMQEGVIAGEEFEFELDGVDVAALTEELDANNTKWKLLDE